jgi:hypothetical protein
MTVERMDRSRITSVLADMVYPVRTWQLSAEADYYGADARTRAALGDLPRGMYASLEAVLDALVQTRQIRCRSDRPIKCLHDQRRSPSSAKPAAPAAPALSPRALRKPELQNNA